ncbi:MAG: BamA/TamA family outer membrane protein [Myxococcaceae bacterium]|nr:BamA/TamA family outer membrane protein [Myxococcaceae bacterium]
MSSRAVCATATRALLLVVCACASTEERPDGPIIDDFDIEGTEQLSERDLKKKVLTGDSFLRWLPVFGKEERFDQNAWAADQRRVERFYQAHGFYQAQVVEEEVKPLKEGHVYLRMKVKEGGPTVIRRLTISGLEPLDDAQRREVLYKLPLKEGLTFLEEEWLETERILKDRLQKLGYATADPKPLAMVDVGTQTAELEIQSNAGRRYKFGPGERPKGTPPCHGYEADGYPCHVSIQNPDGTVDKRLIEDQVTSVIERGDWFTPEALEEAQARVFKMGVFSAVKVARAAPDQATGEVPVTVDVREAPFHTYRAGGGLGGDPLRNEIRGTFLYENRNFLGGTRRLTLRARAGYAFLSGTSSSGFFAFASVFSRQTGAQHGPFGRLTAEAEQPHFLHRALALRGTVEPSYTIEPAYRAGGGAAKLALVWRPTSTVTASFGYNFSVYQLSTPVALGAQTTAFVGCGLTCVLHNLEQTLAWDRRDDVLEPHDGWYLAVSLQEGGNTLTTGQFAPVNFFRFLPEARFYRSFFDQKFTIAGKVRFGALITLAGTAPIPVRFFSGGNDMRGFSARRLAPFDVVPRTDCGYLAIDAPNDPLSPARQGTCPGDGEVLPVGGNALLDGSLELRWNVWESLTIATFVDAGYVSGSGVSVALLSSLNVAVGLGVRYRTPIGPIRVDLAARLPVGAPLERAGVLRQHAYSRGCFFGLGAGTSNDYAGAPEGQCAFHVSIGEAF